jgi:hypothetical protein
MRHRSDFGTYEAAIDRHESQIMVPIDIPAVAAHFRADADSVFGRLYYYLDPKYAEPAFQGKPRKPLFTRLQETTGTASTSPARSSLSRSMARETPRSLGMGNSRVFARRSVSFARCRPCSLSQLWAVLLRRYGRPVLRLLSGKQLEEGGNAPVRDRPNREGWFGN